MRPGLRNKEFTYHGLMDHGVAACDVTGCVASLNFDATELQILKVILEAQVTQICSMDILRCSYATVKYYQS